MFNDLFDAYTIKKIAPRLLVAVIGINLSIYLCVAAVDITNIIGGGLGDLLREPFRNSSAFNNPEIPGTTLNFVMGSGMVGFVGLAALGATGAASGIGFLGAIAGAAWALAGSAFLAMGLFLLVSALSLALLALSIAGIIIIRYGAIILFTVISPIAIALLVLPGTEKYFKQWWNMFMKLLIMYPVFAVIFAMSDILASIFMATLVQKAGLPGFLAIFMVVLATFIPFFLVPFALKITGGIIGVVNDLADKRRAAYNEAARKRAEENPFSLRNRIKDRGARLREDNRVSGGVFAAGLAQAVGGLKHEEDGLNRRQRVRERFSAGVRAEKAKRNTEREAKIAETTTAKMLKNNDDISWMMLEDNDADRIKVLQKRDPTLYRDGPNAAKNVQDALAHARIIESHAGKHAARELAAKNIVSAPTWTEAGLEGKAGVKLAQLASRISVNSTQETQMLATLREAASKRLDASAASFTNHSIILQMLKTGKVYKKNDDGSYDVASGPIRSVNIADPAELAKLEEELTMDFMESVHQETTAGQRAVSHKKSVQTDVEYLDTILPKLTANLTKVKRQQPDGTIVETDEIDWNAPANHDMIAQNKKLQLALASVQSSHESLQFSPGVSSEKMEGTISRYKEGLELLKNGVKRKVKDPNTGEEKVVLRTFDTFDAVIRSWRNSQEYAELQSGGGDPTRRGQGPAQ